MSRLYYDKPKIKAGINAEGGAPPTSVPEPAKAYFEKVASLIPVEIVTAYIAAVGLVPQISIGVDHQIVYGVIFLICLILTPIYFNYQAEKKKPKVYHLIISTLAFVIWAYTVSGAQIIPDCYDASIASIVLIGFSLIAGTIPLKK